MQRFKPFGYSALRRSQSLTFIPTRSSSERECYPRKVTRVDVQHTHGCVESLHIEREYTDVDLCFGAATVRPLNSTIIKMISTVRRKCESDLNTQYDK